MRIKIKRSGGSRQPCRPHLARRRQSGTSQIKKTEAVICAQIGLVKHPDVSPPTAPKRKTEKKEGVSGRREEEKRKKKEAYLPGVILAG